MNKVILESIADDMSGKLDQMVGYLVNEFGRESITLTRVTDIV